MLRIGIVDDHQLFRKSLSLLVDSFDGTKVVLEAENGLQLFEMLEIIPLDLLLLDIQMPQMDGYETCQILRKKYPDIKVLIVSQLATRESIHKVMELGAHGFFSKNSNPEQLELAIMNIYEKDFYFGQELGTVLKEAILWQKNYKIDDHILSTAQISARELDVIKLACREYSSSEIAEKLFISVRTVETHRKRIMEKTQSKNFIGVVLFILKQGLITVEEL
ncbi:response regulator transcription factor [uncultured Flavobacterium sp.]|uniref:response regulator transcription factor n=1 Tax=uncultured Flavobacterium sp. TaxID=165435 RepID=UPI0025FF99C0|nr:response regulator transcription factor [uncultured Flavobacterium sp.]